MSEKEKSFKVTCAFCKQDISDTFTDENRQNAMEKFAEVESVILCKECLKDHFMLRCETCGSYLVMKQDKMPALLNQINAQGGMEFPNPDGTLIHSTDENFAENISELLLSHCPGCGAKDDEVSIKGLVLKQKVAALFK